MTVFVSASTSGMPFFPDTTDTLRRVYSTRDHNQAREFFHDLNPVLKTAGLNRFRVLVAIAEVFDA